MLLPAPRRHAAVRGVPGGRALCLGLTGNYLGREDEWNRREVALIFCGETFSTQ